MNTLDRKNWFIAVGVGVLLTLCMDFLGLALWLSVTAVVFWTQSCRLERWMWWVSPLTVLPFLAGAAAVLGYATGTASLLCYGLMGPGVHSLNPDIRCGYISLGCVVNPVGNVLVSTYDGVLVELTRQFGIMPLAWRGAYPTEEQAFHCIDSHPDLPSLSYSSFMRDSVSLPEVLQVPSYLWSQIEVDSYPRLSNGTVRVVSFDTGCVLIDYVPKDRQIEACDDYRESVFVMVQNRQLIAHYSRMNKPAVRP